MLRSHSEPLKQLELYEQPAILKAYSDFAHSGQRQLGIGVVNRPSTVAGQRYDDVDHAYIRAVRSVLTGKTRAPEAATELEKELVGITGFKTGPPSPIQSPKHRTAERVR